MRNMNNKNLVKMTLSMALISAMGLGGCNSSNNVAQNDQVPQEEQSIQSTQKQGYNTVTGNVEIDQTPVNEKSRALVSNEADIVAYNLDDGSVYKTKSDVEGNYTLSGLSDGEYQVIAQNDQYAKSSVQRVTLGKQSRVVVDFKLTATGSVSGKIAGAHIVYIPGTDHISIAKEDGTFSLTGVPVGTYTLFYEADGDSQRNSIDVTVNAGEVAAVDLESGFSTESSYNNGDDFGYIPTALELGVLELYYEGIPFYLYHLPTYMIEDPSSLQGLLSKYVTLKNSAGEDIPFLLDINYDNNGVRKYVLKTKEIVPAGDYTVTFSKNLNEVFSANSYDIYQMTDDHSYTFHVDKLTVVVPDVEDGVRMLSLYFPEDMNETQKETLNTLKLVEAGTTDAVDLKPVWSSDHELNLFGSFKTGVEYTFDLTDTQKDIIGQLKEVDDTLMFGKAEVTAMYPANAHEDVRIEQPLYVEVDYANEIDPSTVTFTLNGQTYSGKTILFDGQNSYSDDSFAKDTHMTISFDHDALDYGTTYTLTFTAKDMSGNTLQKETTFKTMTPAVVEMDPEGMEELFDDHMSVEFNVPVDTKSGTLTLESLSGDSTAYVNREQDIYYNDAYRILYSLDGLQPNQRYKLTISGVKDLEGNEIPAKSIEFATPPKMLIIPDEFSQKVNVSGDYVNHQVRLYFFGGLTDTQKEALENNLVVQSYGQPVPVDETHPVRKLFFQNDESGTEVIVAFTIDPQTNYELVLTDKSAFSDIVMPDNTKLLSFATIRDNTVSVDPNAMPVIMNFSVDEPHMEFVYDEQTQEESAKLLSAISASVDIPFAVIENDNDTEYESCWNIAENNDMWHKATQMVQDAISVTESGNNVELSFNDKINWSISERWNSDYRTCVISYSQYYYDYQPLAYFAADYNKTYDVSLSLDDISVPVSVRETTAQVSLKTDPIGTMEYGLFNQTTYDSTQSVEPIYFGMRFNAPMKLDNLDSLFTVKVNGELFQPAFEYDGVEDGEALATEIRFAVPRTLYSVVQIEIAKNDGQDMVFINPLTGEEVVNNSGFEKPLSIMENVAPDLLPVKVEEVKTTSIDNDTIMLKFNRPVFPADVATIADDGTVTDVKFEVKANDGTAVAITGVDAGYEELYFKLSEELNASKIYTISLKDGESVKAAYGAQELKSFSQEVSLTYADMDEPIYVIQNSQINQETPFMLGSTDYGQVDWRTEANVILPVVLKDGAVLNMDDTQLKVTYAYDENNVLNEGALEYDPEANLLIQKVAGDYYSLDVYANVVYSVGDKAYQIDSTYRNLYSIRLVSVESFYGDGANAITFDFSNVQEGYQITAANFEVRDLDGNEVNATIDVQFNDAYDISRPTVSFDNLQPDTTYGVVIKGIPSYDPIPGSDSMIIDTLLLQTPAQ